MTEIKFKPEGQYLSRCHQWVGEPAPDGSLPGWSAHGECWWAILRRPNGGRWVIAGPTRVGVGDAVADAEAAGMTEWAW